MRRLAILVVLLPLPFLSMQALAGDNCCPIVSIDTARGVVTATETATGRTFSFTVRNTALLDQLKPGMTFDTRGAPGGNTFSLMNMADVRPEWGEECCTLVGESVGPRVNLAQAANRVENCCDVVSIDQGVVTARVVGSGRTFGFGQTMQLLVD